MAFDINLLLDAEIDGILFCVHGEEGRWCGHLELGFVVELSEDKVSWLVIASEFVQVGFEVGDQVD